MKTAGILGGIGPESTIAYYRQIIALYGERSGGASPSLLINSVDVGRLLAFMNAGQLDAVVEYLVPALEQLGRGGADFAVIAANTPHIVFDQLARRSPVPLLSLIEATAGAIARDGLRTVALLGTKFTMQAGFYEKALTARAITLVVPSPDEQEVVHAIYIGELLRNVFLDASRDRITSVIAALRERAGIEAVILGGTELPLLLTEPAYDGVRAFDTTAIHVAAVVGELLA